MTMPAQEEVLTTDIDGFLELVKDKKRITLTDVAKLLNIPILTIQAWTDFLVEEKILGIEYKFTTPYIFIIEDKPKDAGMQGIGFESKDDFFKKAREKGIREGHINLLWAKYLVTNKELIKQKFFEKAEVKGVARERIEVLWEKYYALLEG